MKKNGSPGRTRSLVLFCKSFPFSIYTPGEVSALLNVSYDTAVRRMQKMKGCVDMGTQTKRYQRGKKLLRISDKNLVAFLRGKTRG